MVAMVEVIPDQQVGEATRDDTANSVRSSLPLYNDITPANTTVYWVGLAISYSETVTMTLNGSTLTGPLGSAPWNDGLFQELNQAITGKLDSGDSYVPGS